ncbi:MAG TPA: hypothetical protein ENH82_06185 [bacterium]|nr:hypothetical protein [bacterium]
MGASTPISSINFLSWQSSLNCSGSIPTFLARRKLLNVDKKIDSPYNTYTHRGLPPGSICNPGKASLIAAIRPSNTKFLYFVAQGDGSHIFSKTQRAHINAKNQIKRELRRSRNQN